jgi:hypothetical protein
MIPRPSGRGGSFDHDYMVSFALLNDKNKVIGNAKWEWKVWLAERSGKYDFYVSEKNNSGRDGFNVYFRNIKVADITDVLTVKVTDIQESRPYSNDYYGEKKDIQSWVLCR